MELTKQRKILIGVLGVGLLGLAVDRFVLGLPAEANAAATVVNPPVAAADPQPVAGGQGTAAAARVSGNATTALPDYTALTQRLDALGQTAAQDAAGSGRDLFAEPEAWVPAVPEAAPVDTPRPPIEDPVEFLEHYQLESIVIRALSPVENVMVAQINGVEHREGATLEMFVLRGFTDNPTDGRGAVWESIRTGQMFVMRVAR